MPKEETVASSTISRSGQPRQRERVDVLFNRSVKLVTTKMKSFCSKIDSIFRPFLEEFGAELNDDKAGSEAIGRELLGECDEEVSKMTAWLVKWNKDVQSHVKNRYPSSLNPERLIKVERTDNVFIDEASGSFGVPIVGSKRKRTESSDYPPLKFQKVENAAAEQRESSDNGKVYGQVDAMIECGASLIGRNRSHSPPTRLTSSAAPQTPPSFNQFGLHNNPAGVLNEEGSVSGGPQAQADDWKSFPVVIYAGNNRTDGSDRATSPLPVETEQEQDSENLVWTLSSSDSCELEDEKSTDSLDDTDSDEETGQRDHVNATPDPRDDPKLLPNACRVVISPLPQRAIEIAEGRSRGVRGGRSNTNNADTNQLAQHGEVTISTERAKVGIRRRLFPPIPGMWPSMIRFPDPPVNVPQKTNYLLAGLFSNCFKRESASNPVPPNREPRSSSISKASTRMKRHMSFPWPSKILSCMEYPEIEMFIIKQEYALPYEIWCWGVLYSRQAFQQWGKTEEKTEGAA